MEAILDFFSSEIAIRALLASSMVGVMCGILGTFLVLRNMSLIGDALSHAILPGVYFAFVFVGAYSTVAFFIGSSIAGLIAAISMSWIQQNVPTKNDAAIGIIFTAMFSIGVIGISELQDQHVHLDLKDFLFGNVLGISNEDLWLALGVMIYTIISVIIFYRYLFISTFQNTIAKTMGIPTNYLHYFLMLLLSFVVVASLRAVGVILVVAMLITPAATALLLSNKLKVVIYLSALMGLIAAVGGMLAAVVLNLPPGPAICVVSASMYFLVVLFSKKNGIIFKMIRESQESTRIEQEDIIKYLFKNEGGTNSAVAEFVGLSEGRVKSLVNSLKAKKMLSVNDKRIQLTGEGKEQALHLIRAHRLWETYQVEELGVDKSRIHPDAERMEHHLSKEDLTRIDKHLGFPENDPHGSPIPPRKE